MVGAASDQRGVGFDDQHLVRPQGLLHGTRHRSGATGGLRKSYGQGERIAIVVEEVQLKRARQHILEPVEVDQDERGFPTVPGSDMSDAADAR